MKLDTLQTLAIAMIIAGTVFDLATTEVLLSVGSVRVGDTIISFSESNPLFHILGHENFLAAYVAVSAALVCLVVALPKIVPRGKATYQLAVMVLATYGIAHLVLGLKNYQIIQAYL